MGEGSRTEIKCDRFECNYDCQISSFRTMNMVENVDCQKSKRNWGAILFLINNIKEIYWAQILATINQRIHNSSSATKETLGSG